MAPLIDHIDQRVGDLATGRSLFDPLMAAMGLNDVAADDDSVCYYGADRLAAFFALTLDRSHRPNGHRVAFGAASPHDVDRLAKVVRAAGARAIEGPELCPEYSGHYYAVFFEDGEGNRYEICSRSRRG